MDALVLTNEMAIRLGFFFATLVVMGVWESLAPRRVLSLSRLRRWFNNLAVISFNTLIIRLLFPAAAVGVAAFAAAQGWGILNHFEVPLWPAIAVAVIVMDLVIYLQHVMVHALPLLWRVHRMHHADLDIDVTTGLRFHPIEIVLSMLIKFATVALLGAPVVAVVLFEVLLNVTSMFNHSNVRIPLGLDRLLRLFVVTPDMHRVHHSIEFDETNSNFGFNLPWWDRLFGTYRAQPRAGHEGMTIGIELFRAQRDVVGFFNMLLIPFRSRGSDSAEAEQSGQGRR
jgi:sterol desaturase/sphingolipid hydroxylase (fatty acid hydroxylase superfamily)